MVDAAATGTIGGVNNARDFEQFCQRLGVDLAPFQRKIASAAFGPERELVCVLPRGQGKTELAALLALHHLTTTRTRASPRRGQPQTGHRRRSPRCAATPSTPRSPTRSRVRHLALRADAGGLLRVVSGRGERAHG